MSSTNLKEFTTLLSTTINAPRLSASKVTTLANSAQFLATEAQQIIAVFYKLNSSLPPASQARVSSLYVFDAIARACKGKPKEKAEGGERARAKMLSKLEGVAASWVKGMTDDGKRGVWVEGKEKTRKVIDIWQKHGTFSQSCLDDLRTRLNAKSSNGLTSASRPNHQRSTTPPSSPPAWLKAKFSRPQHHRSASSSRAPKPSRRVSGYDISNDLDGISEKDVKGEEDGRKEEEPSRPGELPPEIAKMLGIAQSGSTAAPASTSQSSESTPPTHVPQPNHSLPPPSLGIDPKQLAALAGITSGLPLPPPRPAANGQGYGNGSADSHERHLSPQKPGMPRSAFSPPGPGPGAGAGIDNRWEEQRASRDRERDRGRGDYRRPSDDGRMMAAPMSQSHSQNSGGRTRSRSPEKRQQSGIGARRARFADDERPGGRMSRDEPFVPTPKASGLAVRMTPPSHTNSLPPLPPTALPPPPSQTALTQPTPPAPNQLTLETFPLHLFDPSDPTAWVVLGQAWKNSMGREPGGAELMGWLAMYSQMQAGMQAGQVPGSGGFEQNGASGMLPGMGVSQPQMQGAQDPSQRGAQAQFQGSGQPNWQGNGGQGPMKGMGY
ncbi:hypothetical protein IAR50_002856 [Cryptococcus sp. DSM 104548]